MGRVGSSELIEFLIALLVGFLAVLGALFCIGFLLVDPVRNPMGEGEVSPLSKFACVCALSSLERVPKCVVHGQIVFCFHVMFNKILLFSSSPGPISFRHI